MHNPSVLFRDVRNLKRNNTLLHTMTSKDIGSAKDLKKARSSQQLINLKGFLDNKNDKIKTIDQKLEVHQTQIQRNGIIIEELTNTLMALKNQFAIERDKVENEEKKNRQLRDQIQRTNKLLKSKNIRIDQLTRKIQANEKQLELLRPCQQKVEELNKINNQLRKEAAKLEENLSDKKGALGEQLKQMQKLKEKIGELGGLKCEVEKLKAQNKAKDVEIENLNMQAQISQKQNKSCRLKNDESFRKLNEDVRELREKLKEKDCLLQQKRGTDKKMQQKIEAMETEERNLKSQLKQSHAISEALKAEVWQLKQKIESHNQALSRKDEEHRNQSQKYNSMKGKIDELQSRLDMEIAEKAKRKPCEEKLENISKKSKRLEELYRLMVPQIQCPFGHELNNPITVIPCGHNYCLECKKGYSKECMLCNGKLKIEAVYRNELMDDIINIVTGIKQILQMIK